MSLTSFLDMHDIIERVKPLRPKSPRTFDAPLKVQPRTNHYTTVGVGFDYLLRFEIQRRAPHAISRRWVADSAADHICGPAGYEIVIDAQTGQIERLRHDLPPTTASDVADRVHAAVENAKTALASYLQVPAPGHFQLAELAAHAIRLARLDPVVRANRFDPEFEHADQEDVLDLLSMLAIVPFDSLLDSRTVLVNPTFGEASRSVSGADADLITGDLLVDFKASTKATIRSTELDQLLGYFLLGRRHQRVDAKFPEIRRVATYFARHAYLWVLDATTWTQHPEFPAIEEWFFRRAAEVFPPRGPVSTQHRRSGGEHDAHDQLHRQG